MSDNQLSGGGVNSSIPLSGNTGIGAGGGGGNSLLSDPVGTMDKLADVRNKQNQNALFQQSFAAKQRAGQIIAQSPDTEGAIKGLLADPQVAPFAGEIIGQLRNAQTSLIQQQGMIAGQNRDALTGLVKSSLGSLQDPSQLPKMAAINLAALPPEIQARVAPLYNAYIGAIGDGLDLRTPQGQQLFRARSAGAMIGSGLSGENINSMVGGNFRENAGGQIVGGTQDPSFLGGGIHPAPGGIGMSLPPTIHDVPQGDGSTRPTALGGVYGMPTAAPVGGVGGPGNGASIPTGNPPGATGANPTPAAVGPGPSPGGVPIGGATLTPEQEAISKGQGDAGTKMIDMIQDQATKLPDSMKRMDELYTTLGQFQAGGLAPVRRQIATMAQGLKNAGVSGITDDTIKQIGNGSLDANQTFNAVIKTVVTRQMAADVQGTGRVMLPEVQAYLDMANEATSPDALKRILGLALYSYKKANDQVQEFPKYRDGVAAQSPGYQGLKLGDFPGWYNQQLAAGQRPGLAMPNMSPDAEQPKFRYDPGTKRLVPITAPAQGQ